MAGFGWTKPRPKLAVYLIIAVSTAFLFAAVEPIRSFEFEASDSISGRYYASPAITINYLAVVQKIGQNTAQNTFSFFRLGSIRFLISFGLFNVFTAFFKSSLSGKTNTNPINLKESILLKLRI
ncbi:MAG: hypothetical protein LBC60_05220 [Spirochaetaceae bacterium]|jgi:hypothetical protein|nr:hypothetical protein [Spirochaetaceae bacterium]